MNLAPIVFTILASALAYSVGTLAAGELPSGPAPPASIATDDQAFDAAIAGSIVAPGMEVQVTSCAVRVLRRTPEACLLGPEEVQEWSATLLLDEFGARVAVVPSLTRPGVTYLRFVPGPALQSAISEATANLPSPTNPGAADPEERTRKESEAESSILLRGGLKSQSSIKLCSGHAYEFVPQQVDAALEVDSDKASILAIEIDHLLESCR